MADETTPELPDYSASFYGFGTRLKGIQGPPGKDGAQGDPGPQGPQGPGPSQSQLNEAASIALALNPAPKGDKGDTGPQGPQGLQGITGPQGATGPQGLKGDKGDKGDTGAQGPQGLQGLTGPQGLKGDKGDTGAQGPQGLTGPQGPTGDTGPQGPKGDKGDGTDALTFVGQPQSYYTNITARLGYTPVNKGGDTMTGLLTVQGTGLAAGVRFLNSTAGRDYRLVQKDAGYLAITDETAGAERLSISTTGAMTVPGGALFANPVTIQTPNQLLLKADTASNPTVIHRNDGGTYYFLISGNSTAPSSSWNALRPLSINTVTGRLSSANGQDFAGGMTVTNGLTASNGQTFNGGAGFGGKITVTAGIAGNNGMGTATGGLGEVEIQGNGTGAAMMTFHRPGSFAAYFGLHTDNTWRVGGWSMGGVSYRLYHEGFKPTLSQLSNDSGFITTGGRAYPRRSDGGDLNFYWSGQAGQPTWLWGGSDGSNMYVYNPSNFSVNYANSAGVANNAIGYGQQWYALSVAVNTSYQNTYGRPIMVSLYHSSDTAFTQVSADNANWVTLGNGNNWGQYQFIVPPNHYWRISGASTISYAAMLR